MKVALLCLRWCQFGGWPTYLSHLREALIANNINVKIFSIESPTGAKGCVDKIKDFSILKKYDLVHICILPTKDKKIYSEINHRNIVATIHDPTEIKCSAVRNFVSNKQSLMAIYIRKTMLEHNLTKNFEYATYIPHPYKRYIKKIEIKKRNKIISTARIDYDKNTDIILEANCGIEIWTGYINRIYDYHKLGGIKNNPYYMGKFNSVEEIYPQARALVDMSSISGDGGGTQYTFLEAMDYGLTLILNSKWSHNKFNELIPGKHYIPVSNANELRSAVDFVKKIKPNDKKYLDILNTHNHKIIGEQYISLYKKVITKDINIYKNKRGIKGFFND